MSAGHELDLGTRLGASFVGARAWSSMKSSVAFMSFLGLTGRDFYV